MASVLDRVRRYASQHALWSPGTRVVAAVSGGSDSSALLFVLRALAASGDLTLAGLAHLHHGLRGVDADGDAAFCRDLGARLGLPVSIGRVDVPSLAAERRCSAEVAGREARQRFFREAAAALGAGVVAVAHTRDDQTETVLLRLARGAGPAGLAGIAPRRDHLVRPLLELTRDELRAYLQGLGEPWREDATNTDRAVPRNLIRHEVMPLLRAINPSAGAALARAADILRGEAALVDGLVAEAWAGVVLAAAPGRVRLDAAALAGLPAALGRRVALRALETADAGRSYDFEEVECVRAAAAPAGASARRTLPGVSVERFGAEVVLVGRAGAARRGVPGPFELRLPVPGVVEGPGGRWTMLAEGPLPRGGSWPTGRGQVAVDASGLSGGLIVRQRRPGDRLQPLGAPGRRKVQDVLVDRKVPRDDRDAVPIVTDELGRVVWVAGEVLSEAFRVTPLTTTVVVLTLRRA